MTLLPKSVLALPPAQAARALLGMHLVRDGVILRITETEAYGQAGDTASHARHGKSARNWPMFEDAGLAYVYLCYGIHHLFNVSCDRPGVPGAVLIRACEVVEGGAIVSVRRGGRCGPASVAGAGKVGQALGVDVSWSGHSLLCPGGIELRTGDAPATIRVGPRVGIDYAEPVDRDAPLRFAVCDSRAISSPKSTLEEWDGPLS